MATVDSASKDPCKITPATEMDSASASETELRENLVDTAVKFLQNPKVRQTSFEQRRQFLANKGLTTEEIEAAIARSGTSADQHALLSAQQHPAVVQVAPPESGWRKAKDIASTVILIGGLSYGLYMIYKKYIMPVWFGPSEEQKQMTELNRSVKELQGSINDTLKVIQEMQSCMKKQGEQMNALAVADSAAKGNQEYSRIQETQASNEIKEELKSLKGLLLNRKQFPATPKAAPVIPAWQLAAADDANTTNAAESKGKDSDVVNAENEVAAISVQVEKTEETSPAAANSEEELSSPSQQS